MKSRANPGGRVRLVLAIGSALLVLFVFLALLGDAREAPGRFLALAIVAGALHVAASAAAWRLEASRPLLVAIVGLAVLYRAAALAAPPTLSDDIWRYVWEGRVQVAGFDPYRLPPNAVELAFLRDAETHHRINNPEIPAVYPPGHQLVLRGVAAAGGGAFALRALAAAADLLTGLLVLLALRSNGRPLGRAVVALWCPLSIVEFAGSGHADPLFLAALVAAVLFAGARARHRAAIAFGLSIALRAVPLALVPHFAKPIGARIVLSLAIAAATFAPFLGGAEGSVSPFTGAREYAKRWRHNDSAFRGLLAVSESRLEAIESDGPLWMRERVRDHRDDFNPLSGAKTLALVLFAVGLVAIACLRRSLPTSILLTFFLLLLLSTTVHPWYVAWLVPFAALSSRPAPALVFAATAFLSYHVLLDPHPGEAASWTENGLFVAIEYVPVYAALAWEAVRAVAIGLGRTEADALSGPERAMRSALPRPR